MYRKTAVVVALCLIILIGAGSHAYAGGKPKTMPMGLSLAQVCKRMPMPCDYDFRISFVRMLFHNGIRLFGEPNSDSDGYSGSSGENGRLARNIVFNRGLFVGGALPAENVKKWRVVY